MLSRLWSDADAKTTREMALSRAQRSGLTPQEIEFMAMERQVEIVPFFSMKELKDLDKVSPRSLPAMPPTGN